MESNNNYSQRARQARTRAHEKQQAEKEKEMEVAKEGLSAAKWWSKYVRDKQSCRKYF